MMKSIPTCFFPTKVLFIDDDPKILSELKKTLATTYCTYKAFSNPYEGLAYIEKLCGNDSYLNKWLGQGYQHIKNYDYSWRDQIYSAERFEQVSTLIIDHTMPGINGLALCERIKNLPLQKIMLTGDADESLAINAFNDNLIQGFVKKNDPRIFEKLNNLIYKRKIEFFTDLTHSTLEETKEGDYESLLQTPAFVQVFETIIEKFQSVEYYLMDTVGKFLLVDAKGNLSALYVYHEGKQGSMPPLEAEGYFLNGQEFVFPSVPVDHPLIAFEEDIVGRINGQEEEPHHDFPVYKLPGQEGVTWGYIPRLISMKKVISFEDYKNSLAEQK